MNNDVEAIKSRINIVELIGERVRLKKAGRNYFGLCPFHGERSPSFSVNEEIQRYKCFGCGESGDIFTFIMKVENVEFREALEELADKINYKLTTDNKKSDNSAQEIAKILEINNIAFDFFTKELFKENNPGKLYAKKRGLNKDLVNKFGVGFAPESYNLLTTYLMQKKYSPLDLEKYSLVVKRDQNFIDKFRNRLMFSIYDDKGRIVGFAGRFIGMDKGEFKTPKYLNSSETLLFHKSKLLFGLYQAKESIRHLKFAVITEGQMNVISSHRVGVENIVASLGTALTEQHLKLLSRFTENIYFAFDKDTAGKKALLRSVEMCFKLDINVKVITWDPAKGGDPDELISTNPKLWIEAVNSPIDPIEYLHYEFRNKYKNITPDSANIFIKLVLGLLKSHTNKVKVEYYLKYLSEKFDISIEVLKDFGNKNNVKLLGEEKEPESFSDKVISTKKSIFEQIFSLILQNWEADSNLILLVDRAALPEKYQELYDGLSLFIDIPNLSSIRDELTPDLQNLLDDLLMMHTEIDSLKSVEEHVTKLIPMIRIEYKKDLVRQWKENPDDDDLINKINLILGGKDNV